MKEPRLFVDQPVSAGSEVRLDEKSSHYLKDVLRLREDAVLHIFNGAGGYYIARVVSAGKRSVTILPLEHVGEERESGLDLILVQGLSRARKMDFTIQKAVELGVNRIIPVVTEFSQVKLTDERADKRVSHWRGVVISACEQCGRNRLPGVEMPVPLAACPEPGDGTGLMLHPEAEHCLAEITPGQGRILLLAGPEGGLSEKDRRHAEAAGYRSVSLGPRVLRTETAAVAALTACQVLWGDLGRQG